MLGEMKLLAMSFFKMAHNGGSMKRENIMKDVIKETQDEQDIKTRTAVFQNFKSGDDIGVSLIQRKFKCGYFSAPRVLENLIEDGLVEEGKTKSPICKML